MITEQTKVPRSRVVVPRGMISPYRDNPEMNKPSMMSLVPDSMRTPTKSSTRRETFAVFQTSRTPPPNTTTNFEL
jgi:hypothetical protein